MSEADSFFSRWSRRKQLVREGQAVQPEPAAQPIDSPLAAPLEPGADASALSTQAAEAAPAEPAAQPPPPPTLEEAQTLTAESDFTRFVAPDVSPEVKNAALKTLFTDPHFNVMDGLDVYIDDYSKPDPISPDMLKQLASAKFLKLFEEKPEAEQAKSAAERAESAQPREVADNPDAQTVAQSATDQRPKAEEKASYDHAHPDLRLQQDDAPGPPGPESSSS